MDLIDVALDYLKSQSMEQESPNDFMQLQAGRFGKKKLYTDSIDLDRTKKFLYLSQIAFLISRFDGLCNSVKKHERLNSSYLGEAKGDFFRKTLYVIVKNRSPHVAISNPITENDCEKIISVENFRIFDYFRTIRNEEIHHSTLNDENYYEPIQKILKTIDDNYCKKQFGNTLSPPQHVAHSDVVIFSKVLQSITQQLLSHILDIETDIKPYLEDRFGQLVGNRRENGARISLKLEFLLPDHKIDNILCSLGWLA